jgi:peroxiredoxin
MAQKRSSMVSLGTKAPQFSLPDTQGKRVSSDDFKGAPALLVAFICSHCPYVRRIRPGFAQLAKEYQKRGVAVVAISSNDAVSYPEDGPEKMAQEAQRAAYTFPYLYDKTQKVARAFQAACTPDFFLFDRQQRLVYRGQFDDSRPGNGHPVSGADLRAALDAVLAGHAVSENQKPSIGCNIKWRTETTSAAEH